MSYIEDDDFECENNSSLESLLEQFKPIKQTGATAKLVDARKWFKNYIMKKYQTDYLNVIALQYLSFGDFDKLALSVKLAENEENEEFVKSLYCKSIDIPLSTLSKVEVDEMLNNFEEIKLIINDFSKSIQLLYSLYKEPKKYIAYSGKLENSNELCFYIEQKEEPISGDIEKVYI